MADPRRTLGQKLLQVAGSRIEALEDLLEPYQTQIMELADGLEAAALACPLQQGALEPAASDWFVAQAEAVGATLVAHITCQRLFPSRKEQKGFEALANRCRQLLKDQTTFLVELGARALDPEPRVRFPLSLFLKRSSSALLTRRVPRSEPLQDWQAWVDRGDKLLERARAWLKQPVVFDDGLLMAELLAGHPDARKLLKARGLMCWDCVVVCEETLDEAAAYHPFDKQSLVEALQAALDKPEAEAGAEPEAAP